MILYGEQNGLFSTRFASVYILKPWLKTHDNPWMYNNIPYNWYMPYCELDLWRFTSLISSPCQLWTIFGSRQWEHCSIFIYFEKYFIWICIVYYITIRVSYRLWLLFWILNSSLIYYCDSIRRLKLYCN